jgi:hypothetical protein
LAAGGDGVLIAPPAAQVDVRRQAGRGFGRSPEERKRHEALIWEAICRKVQRHSPGFDE